MAPTPVVIDLSHHNVVPESLKPARNAGIVGLIHKATEGTGYVDDKLAARHHLAQDAGMLFGGYHFIRPGNIASQASHFVTTMQALGDDTHYLYALDWEDKAVSAEDAVAFLEQVAALTGHDPVLYSGHVCKEDPDERLGAYRLWLAQYGASCSLPSFAESWWLWQYTESGSIPGVQPPTDLNTYDGPIEDLIAEWSGNIVAPPQPQPIPGVSPEICFDIGLRSLVSGFLPLADPMYMAASLGRMSERLIEGED